MKKKIIGIVSLLSILLAIIVAGTSGANEGLAKESKQSKETTIYLVRHGKTWFNTQNQVQGFSDSLLTEEGETQAKLVGEGLEEVKFTAAYSSDLGRQRKTAQLILAQNGNKIPPIVENKGFREKNFGGFEGQSNDDMNLAVAKALNLDYPEGSDELWDFLKDQLTEEELANKVADVDPTKTAETYDQMKQRVEKAMPQVMKKAAKKGGNVLIVSSGGIIPILLESVAPGKYQGEKIANCSVTTLTYKDGAYTVKKIGDTHFVDQKE
ncbi:MAG: histidine phosphatase family protein [Enterococcus viikkiensis]|uniref:histidine phosphatase family protein n=1 Tax=Enterococcus viikkiensis TaxID=930854 RepID=UPI003F8F9F7B